MDVCDGTFRDFDEWGGFFFGSMWMVESEKVCGLQGDRLPLKNGLGFVNQ